VPDERVTRDVAGAFVGATVAGDDIGEDVAVVGVPWEEESLSLEEGFGVGAGSLVDELAGGEEDEVVDHGEDLLAGLVDGCNHGNAEPGEGPERAHDGGGGRGVEARGWFVEKDGHWCGGELHADTNALSLPATDDRFSDCAHKAVLHMVQLETFEDGVHVGVHVGGAPGSRQSDSGRVQDVLAHR